MFTEKWWRQREQGAAFQSGPPNYTLRERFVLQLQIKLPRFLGIFELRNKRILKAKRETIILAQQNHSQHQMSLDRQTNTVKFQTKKKERRTPKSSTTWRRISA